MQRAKRRVMAHLFHTLVADYRSRIPTMATISAGIGVVIVIASVIMIVTDSLSVLSIIGLLVGGLMIVPTIVVSTVLNDFQDLRYHVRDAIVSNVTWHGDEQVLDVGTGSGLTLFGCAEQLTTGKATGIDLFVENSGGGTEDIFWKNARHEGVQDKVDLKVMDARDLSFDDDTFDVIVSTGVMHHIGDAIARIQASREMVRVLKPSGKILVFDHAVVLAELDQTMCDAGFVNIIRRGGESLLLMGEKLN